MTIATRMVAILFIAAMAADPMLPSQYRCTATANAVKDFGLLWTQGMIFTIHWQEPIKDLGRRK